MTDLSVEAELLRALKVAREMIGEIGRAINHASTETQDCPSEPWEKVYDLWFNGTIASYRDQIESAIARAKSSQGAAEAETPATFEGWVKSDSHLRSIMELARRTLLDIAQDKGNSFQLRAAQTIKAMYPGSGQVDKIIERASPEKPSAPTPATRADTPAIVADRIVRALINYNVEFARSDVTRDEARDLIEEKIAALLSQPQTPAPPTPDKGWRPISDEISAERRRQIEVEGWTPAHDDDHHTGDLARAAASYATFATFSDEHRAEVAVALARLFPQSREVRATVERLHWPWEIEWFKPKDRRRDLIRAAALIVAEIERLDRAAPPLAPQQETEG